MQYSDHYDAHGRLLDDYDPCDEPVLRRHCLYCGGFLPKCPEERINIVPLDWEYAYHENNEVIGIIVHSEMLERFYVWVCQKCRKEYEACEMYIYS